MTGVVLPRHFYEQDTVDLARGLIGRELHRLVDGHHLVGRIVETEAYCGPDDDACHSAKGRTSRTEVLFGPAGHAYVYLIYGMWNCLNVVARPEGEAHAVLIRGVQPLAGEEYMIERRGRRVNIADGPGKLCQAFGIDRRDNGVDLLGDRLFLTAGTPAEDVMATPRIGIDYATRCREELWRFVERG